MLAALNLSIQLGGRRVVHELSCRVEKGEVVGLIGPNGSGKSTLVRALAGLLAPESGSVELNGVSLRRHMPREVARTVAYLPQGAECHWPISAESLVALGRLPFGGGSRRDDETHVTRALAQVDALELRHRVVTELSGGERARVFLARALATDPALLLIDEPAAGLDPFHQLQLMELLVARARQGCGILVVLHDLGLAARFCSRLLLLKEGRLLADGVPEAVLTDNLLAEAHSVTAYRNRHADQPILVPWERRV